MLSRPLDHSFTTPYPPYSQFGFGWGKVVIGANELVNPLPRYAKNLSHLGGADEGIWHKRKLANTCDLATFNIY